MNIELAYGKTGIMFNVPDDVEATVIRKAPLPIPADADAVINEALDTPFSAPRLEEAAKDAHSACILICDITRPVPNHLFLRPMIERLHAAGMEYDNIKVLVATGLHRPNLGDELAELVGDPWVLNHVEVVNHFAKSDGDHVMLGNTSTRATPVGIDRRFIEADIKIATGLVEPHFMAGYSGGRKVISPGIAHHTTIRTFHSARFMEDPLATSCNLEGNPLHEEQLQILKMIGGMIYGLNTVIDEERNLIFTSFGEIIASHQAAVDFVKTSIEVKVPRKFKTVVTSAAGYPLDQNYYQTVKGMVTPLDILEKDGTLIIVSDCSEGLGSPEFRACQQKLIDLGPDAFLKTLLEKNLADIDEWQTEMQLKPMRIGSVSLVSPNMSEEDRGVTGVTCFDSVDDALAAAMKSHDDNAIAVIPEGPYVVPFHAAA